MKYDKNKIKKSLQYAAIGVEVIKIVAKVISVACDLWKSRQKIKAQTTAAMEQEDYKKKMVEETEEIRAKSYERKCKAEVEAYRQKAEIDIWRKNTLNQQQSESESRDADAPHEDPSHSLSPSSYSPKLAPFRDTLERDDRQLSWLVGNMIEEGGRCIIFGPAGVGKSVMSLQLEIAIAGGLEYGFLPSHEENEHESQQVILIDLEMSAAEQKARTNRMTIPDNLFRNTEPVNSMDDLFVMIEQESCGPKVTVIIDNIRKLEEQMSQYNQVNEYYRRIEQTQRKLASENGISVTFITVTHTSKEFDRYKPIQLDDMAGGADLARFCTSAYALIPARDTNVMLKAVKQRNSVQSGEVTILRFVQEPFLHLEFVCRCSEEEGLPLKPKKKRVPAITDDSSTNHKRKGNQKLSDGDKEQVLQLLEQGMMPIHEIAGKFGVSPRTVYRIINPKEN